MDDITMDAETKKIVKKIEIKNSIHVLDIMDVVYIESEGRYLHIYTLKEQMTIRSKLKDFLDGVEEVFLHSHQSFAVNMAYIKKFKKNEIELCNGKIVPISRSRFKSSKEKLIKYLES